ncbi:MULTISPECIES: hypothetical protein [Myxococcus]|uniref:hypothetical protein n=1 Tax=Myxococcus TaxID=32 RepID=UPI00034B425C|nr:MULTISPECIES: hypothetical protein [Myxococcus]QZZ51822.1 hypothetical protein MyxoNM_21690 [Myxococcus xanthus]UYI11564.1 hypothetical protein N3T43_21025 [Myxococcus xanthus]UYI18933.1 hypothetical protein N1129_21475 [Myxococcus xanthus]SDW74368.1 hypothetical protein SAMN05444383_103333 [Myxococcus xanthus]
MSSLRSWSYLPITALALALVLPEPAKAQADGTYPSPGAAQPPSAPAGYAAPPQPTYRQTAPQQPADPYAQPPQTQQPADPYAQPPASAQPADPYAQPPQTQLPVDPYAQPQTQQPSADPYAQPPSSTQPVDPYAQPPQTQQPVDPYAQPQTPQGYPPAQNAYPPSDARDPARYPGDSATASDAPTLPPDPDSLRTKPQSPLTPDDRAMAKRGVPPIEDTGVMLDGRPRQGPFLSGPGSFTFIVHHTTLGALGGFFTQAFASDFNFDKSSREAMLAGTLIGAGLGFGASSWWQFNNWVDRPMATFSIANSVVGGMFTAGLMDLFTQDAGVLTWSAFLGAELGAWLTAGIGGGQLPLNDGLLISSGAGWGAAYSALLLAIIHFSGTPVSGKTWRDTLLLAPGIGAGALALATMRYNPTPSQIVRANIFGGGVGAVVLLLSGVVLGGFDQSTPYVLSFLGSAGAITTVSLLWEESVDRSALKMAGRSEKDRPYTNVWW